MGTIITLGHGKDALGFPCVVQEDTATGQRYLAYSADVWFERNRHIQLLESLGKHIPQETPELIGVETGASDEAHQALLPAEEEIL